MNRDQLEALFPLKVRITKEMIEKGTERVFNEKLCIGATSLKSALPESEQTKVSWGNLGGALYLNGENSKDGVIWIGTRERVLMMDLTKPKTVTFVVTDEYEGYEKE